jgi:hypothetical protein
MVALKKIWFPEVTTTPDRVLAGSGQYGYEAHLEDGTVWLSCHTDGTRWSLTPPYSWGQTVCPAKRCNAPASEKQTLQRIVSGLGVMDNLPPHVRQRLKLRKVGPSSDAVA